MPRYIVIEKDLQGREMHVLKNGNLSFYGKPHKFLTKERAQEVARQWAEVNANCRLSRKVVIRTVE